MPLLRTLLLNGLLGWAGYWTARHGFRMPRGLPRSLAAITLAWTWATLGMEVLGPFGLLGYGPLLAWSAAGWGIGLVLRGRAGVGREERTEAAPTPRMAWEGSAVVALGLIIWASIALGLNSLLGPVKVVSDGPIYHLYFAAQWWKAGRLFLVAAPFGESVVTYFPAVGDLWFTWLLVGWGGDRLAKLGQLPFLVAAALAAFASARRLGAGVSAAVIATCWFVSIMPFLLFTFEPNVDTIFVAGYLLAAYFFLRYALGDEGTEAVALGALASGGVLGAKPTGIAFGGLLLGAAALAVVWRRRSMRQAFGHLVLLTVMPLVMVGSWYGRNAWLTGNPLYPLHLKAFGRVWLAGWYGSDVMRLSPYYIPMAHWRALVDILLAVFDPRLAPFWIAALVGAWSLGRPRPPLAPWTWAVSALALANLVAYWVLVPYRTQQRFMFQAAGLLVVPLALLFERGRWLRVLAAGLLTAHMLTSQSWPFGPSDRDPPWDLTTQVLNIVPGVISFPAVSRLSRGEEPSTEDVLLSIALLAIGVGSVAVAWLWGRPGRRSRGWALLAGAALLAFAFPIAYPFGSDRRLLFFPPFPDYIRGWLALDSRAGPSGARIAYAGTNLPYYLLGVDLRNTVRYVNIDAHRGWLMHDYHRLARRRGEPTWPSPWPAWDRLHPDYDAWLSNLRAEGIQILVVASMGRPRGSLLDVDPYGFPIERRWAESHPESFEPLYGIAEGDQFQIYRVRPAPTSEEFATESGARSH